MATIADLHTSISDMSEDVLFTHIRQLRSLRRELPPRTVKKTAKKKTNKKSKQITIDDYLNNMKKAKKEELLKKLLEIKGRRNGS